MIDQVAFQVGFLVTLATTLFSFTIWILAASKQLRIESVGILQAPVFKLFTTKINSIELILGWLPIGSFVKIAGMIDESLDSESNETLLIQEYEFRGRPLATKILVIMTSPSLLTIIGSIILSQTSPISFGEFLQTYFQINFFQRPIEDGAIIWNAFYTSPLFLLGFIFLFLGFSNIVSNLSSILEEKYQNTFLLILLPFLMLILGLVIYRLIWANLTWLNLLYFFAGGILMGIFSFIIALVLAKILPQV